MHFPEFVLQTGRICRLRSERGVLMHGKGVVREYDADIVRILLKNTRDSRFDFAAEGAFVITEFNDGHEGIGIPFHRAAEVRGGRQHTISVEELGDVVFGIGL